MSMSDFFAVEHVLAQVAATELFKASRVLLAGHDLLAVSVVRFMLCAQSLALNAAQLSCSSWQQNSWLLKGITFTCKRLTVSHIIIMTSSS